MNDEQTLTAEEAVAGTPDIATDIGEPFSFNLADLFGPPKPEKRLEQYRENVAHALEVVEGETDIATCAKRILVTAAEAVMGEFGSEGYPFAIEAARILELQGVDADGLVSKPWPEFRKTSADAMTRKAILEWMDEAKRAEDHETALAYAELNVAYLEEVGANERSLESADAIVGILRAKVRRAKATVEAPATTEPVAAEPGEAVLQDPAQPEQAATIAVGEAQ